MLSSLKLASHYSLHISSAGLKTQSFENGRFNVLVLHNNVLKTKKKNSVLTGPSPIQTQANPAKIVLSTN